MHRRHWKGLGTAAVALAGSCLDAQTAKQAGGQVGGCAGTPAGAIAAARAEQSVTALQTVGYRVESVRWDAAQRQTWAVIRSCDHAERPTLAMLADLPHHTAAAATVPTIPASSSPQSSEIARANTASVLVHAGEAVRLWRADGLAHIELIATAEENGAAGAKIRLRLMTAKDNDGQTAPPRYLAGIVRGPADVEIDQ